jgi:hypothetical protein
MSVELREKRKKCMTLYEELQKWSIPLSEIDQHNLKNAIKFSYNQKRLILIYDQLTIMVDNAMMRKLSQGL